MISDNYTPEKYLGNGTTTNFAFGFAILAEANIRVFLEETTTLVQTAQVLGTDFSIDSGYDSDGGTIEFTTAPTSSYNVIISRDIAETQEVGYKTSSGFQGKVIENSFDKLTTMVQDAVEVISRCLRYPVGTVASTENEVAVPSTTAGYTYWDGSAYSIVEAITATGDYPADITVGTDVSKSATPAVGDIHVATDTDILYICFTAGSWTDFNQEIIDQNILQIMNLAQDNYAGGNAWFDKDEVLQQSFSPSRDMYISQLSLWHSIAGTIPSTQFTIRIETDNAGVPSGTLATGFTEVSASTGSPSLAWETYSLGFIGKLTAGTKYWLVLEVTGIGDTLALRYASSDVMSGEQWRIDAGAFSDNDIAFRLNQGSTLAVGDAVKVVANSFGEAQADTEANSNGFVGIVEAVTTVSYYSFVDIVMSGVVENQSSLVGGTLYYLDPATAGDYTATKPTSGGQYVKPVMVALSETVGVVINQVGTEIVASTTDMVFWENSAVGYENEVVYNQ